MPRRVIRRRDSPRRGHPAAEADNGEGEGDPNGHLR